MLEKKNLWSLSIIVLLLLVPAVQANVIHMESGLSSLETVPVGNLGNSGQLSGEGQWATVPARVCGAVNYEYNIGKYMVTAAQYCEFLNAVAAISDTYGLYDELMWESEEGCKIQRTLDSGFYRYSVTSDRANRPVNSVEWSDAARFANWLHNGQPTGPPDSSTTEDGAYNLVDNSSRTVSREHDWKWAIPSEDEWYKAAYHKNDGNTGNYYMYPTSSDDPPSNRLVDPDLGNNANFYQNNNYTIGGPYWTTEVGAFENSPSPYGTFDQGGNLFELNETLLDEQQRRRGLRGGCFWSKIDYHHLTSSYRETPGVSPEYYGFRVVCVPEPSSIVLLFCIAIIGLIGWRR